MNKVQHLIRLARQGWEHKDWYQQCQPILNWAAERSSVSLDRFIDVLSITSPRCSVTRNVRVTQHYLDFGSLPKDVIRSTRAALKHYEESGEIRGPKTSAFAAALRGDPDAIVLDTWMSVALGVDQQKFSDAKRVRQSAARRIRFGAYCMGITPAEFQAAVWSGTVLKAGRNVPRMDSALQETFS